MTVGRADVAEPAACEGASRRPGRPRSVEADVAILGAAAAVFAECGFEGMTVEGVALRAGVGKGTIYRRYPCKLDLVIAAAGMFSQADEPPVDTGSTAGDLRALADSFVSVLTETPLGAALPMLVAERARIPELRAAIDDVVHRKRARSGVVVSRAIEGGGLRPDADVEQVIESLSGPILYRFLITDLPLDDAFTSATVDAAIRAFGNPAPG
jgi:AcrR family transcriptional regulator